MFMLNKRVQKLIAKGTALIITLTVMIGAAWAILSTEQMGLSVSVSYTSPVTAKVYLATNSSTAGAFRQISPTVNVDPLTDFDTTKSALIFNTYDSDTNGGLNKTAFEQLGTGDSNGLKCDANGEMEFYVYVENYSTTENVYYRANIDFVGEGDKTASFDVTNPSLESCEVATEPETPAISLLIFKIKSSNDSGLNMNSVKIRIELFTSIFHMVNLNYGQYTSGNYTGLYYVEFGAYPKTNVGTTQPSGTVEVSPSPYGSNTYWVNSDTGEKFVKKSTTYYKVEPVRWLIIGNGGSHTGLPNKNYDGLQSNQLLLLSTDLLVNYWYHSSYTNVAWGNTTLYKTDLVSLKNAIFNNDELQKLGDILEYENSGVNYYSKLSILSYNMTFKYTDYCTTNQIKCSFTPYAGSTSYGYWVRNAIARHGTGNGDGLGNCTDNGIVTSVYPHNGTTANVFVKTYSGIRPIIILDL